MCSELAFESVFQQRLAIHLELRACGFQVFDALVQFGKQLFDFSDDTVLFGEGWKQDKLIICMIPVQARYGG